MISIDVHTPGDLLSEPMYESFEGVRPLALIPPSVFGKAIEIDSRVGCYADEIMNPMAVAS